MSVEFLHKEGLEYLSSLPDESVDLVLTDPPYITSRDSGMDKWVDHVAERDSSGTDDKTEAEWEAYSSGMNWDQFAKNGSKPLKIDTLKDNYLKYGSIYGKKYAVRTNYGAWDSEFTMEDLQLFINHFYRVLKPGGTCIVFFDLWKITPLKEQLEGAKFKQIRFLEWVKTNPQPINSKVNYLTNCREIALLGIKKSKPTFNSSYDNAIYKFPIQGGKDRFHPTQKNTKLFEELIKKHSNEGDVVLDPFLGSGTTAIAAINTDRNFLGCEMEQEYFEKAKSRISRALHKEELGT
jgi:site-specific DNA-methyltransferase (adenine-specific)